MPRLEPKQVQKELEKEMLWPVYWIHGQESMIAREIFKRIRKAVLGNQASTLGGFSEETLDGAEASTQTVIDSAQSLSLGGGVRLVVVRDAHLLKEAEQLSVLLGPAAKKSELGSVCVFMAKDLDGRKKFSKTLVEKAAVIACEEVGEDEREAWIGYLAKARGLDLAPQLVAQLRSLDPWTLDIVDQELQKYALALPELGAQAGEVLLGSLGDQMGTEEFLNAFFTRDLKIALECIESFAESPDESLPLLGLIGWNARYLALVVSDREHGTKSAKLSPYLADRFNRWARRWTLKEALRLQSALAELDFGIKQTARMPLGLWATLVSEFCQTVERAQGSSSSPRA